jgi:hypothetical protein
MMLWHVVKISFKPETTIEEHEACEQALRDQFEASSDVEFYRIGRSVIPGDTSRLVLSGFADQDAMNRYLTQPLHQAARAVIGPLRATAEPNYIDAFIDDSLTPTSRA